MITAKELLEMGYPQGPVIGAALKVIDIAEAMAYSREAVLHVLNAIRNDPTAVKEGAGHPNANEAARALAKEWRRLAYAEKFVPRENPQPYEVFGRDMIEPGAIEQMDSAMRLPPAVAGALMPDAHQGYGLPIGGVLALEDAVSPYAVGVDVACRMMFTLFDAKDDIVSSHGDQIAKALQSETAFGQGSGGLNRTHGIMEDPRWREVAALRNNYNTASYQLGSSGGGNHFVTAGYVNLTQPLRNQYGLVPPGVYFAIISHSGSRGLGKKVCDTYTRIAMDQHKALPKEMKHLAWLDMDSEAGQEYWLAMNLCGDYASANHHLIHQHIGKKLGLKPLVQVENHHNFAWIEEVDGRDVYVHRKGATPAGEGVLGIIPGTMADPSFIVRGKGSTRSLKSSSHGAGRKMGRREAERTLDREDVQAYLDKKGIRLLGGGLDEAPQVYKDIHQVIAAQEELIEPVAMFIPKIVIMAGDSSEI